MPATILVVDDDPRNLLAMEASFQEEVPLVLASSGQEAIRWAEEREFAAILLDVMMPELDGFETARRIRALPNHRHTPILFVTAHPHDAEEVRQGYALGAVDFLFKPVRPDILEAKVAVFVELHRRAERLQELERSNHERLLAEERQRWEAEALRAENARKDEFLATLSHELRNPLNALLTSVPVLRARAGTNAEPTIGSMERQVRHLARLVEDLLDVGRINSGKILLRIGPTTLADAVDQAVEITAARVAERCQTLRVEAPADRVSLVADGHRLTQIVCNLLSNAARYTDRGGRITVAYGVEGGAAWIRVTDDGRGIAPAMLPRVFELFAQERRNAEGLGIGLALSLRLAEMHQGTIVAESEGPGCGSAFELRLPRVVPMAPGVPRAQSQRERLRILVVDDDTDVRCATASFLEVHGHDVDQVSCGADAVQRAADWGPQVVLLDLAMPGLDGYGTAALLQKQLGDRTAILVAMSGFGAVRDRERSRAARFAAHLVKPVDPEELLSTLAGVVRS